MDSLSRWPPNLLRYLSVQWVGRNAETNILNYPIAICLQRWRRKMGEREREIKRERQRERESGICRLKHLYISFQP